MQQDTNNIDATGEYLRSKGYVAVQLRQNVPGQLLIDARINGVPGLYILDTGAGQTVIDSSRVEELRLNLSLDEVELTGGGVGGHGIENVPSYGNTIELDGFSLSDFPVAVMSLSTAWESLAAAGANDVLFGIIGVDLLKRGKGVIDFGEMRVFLIN